MKKVSKILWGAALISVGAVFALNAFGIADIRIFFDGWWTLFIIVPSFIGIFSERKKLGNIIGLMIGVFLLLCCQDVLGFDMLWKIAVPAIIVIIGLKLIFGAVFGDRAVKMLESSKKSGENVETGCATFSSRNMDFSGERFSGAELSPVQVIIRCLWYLIAFGKSKIIKTINHTIIIYTVDFAIKTITKIHCISAIIMALQIDCRNSRNIKITVYHSVASSCSRYVI